MLTRFRLLALYCWYAFWEAWWASEIERLDRLIAKHERFLQTH
jgi:hypothetical protein